MPVQPGSTIAGYRVVELLGSGGMGDVYVVENPTLHRQEAMKVISVAGASNAEFGERFANEARTAASLDHPSIITVHSYGVIDAADGASAGTPWFTMSHIDGPDLASTRLTPAEIVEAIGKVADGLDYAHGRGVIHRDVKPANIVITRDEKGALARAVMLDFGIAKLADSPHLTAMNSVVGTMAYTAPEIISGQPASARSDQYSLACTVYDVLTGHAPFRADTATALMMAHVQQQPPPLGAERPDLTTLGPVLGRAMSKDPAARYPSCRAFADDLKKALAQTEAGTATTIAPTPVPLDQNSNPHNSNPQQAGAGRPGPMPSNPSHPNPPPHQFAQHPQQFSNPQQANPFGAPSGPWHPDGQYGQASRPKRSRRGLWIGLAAVAAVIVAVAATIPLWWPSSDEETTVALRPEAQVASAFGTVCAIVDTELKCWGDNTYGEVGDGTSSDRSTPATVPGLSEVTAVSIGGFLDNDNVAKTTTCAVADGSAYCWGYGGSGQVGDGTMQDTPHTVPREVTNLENVTAIATSFGATCAVSEGDLYCWGYGKVGQLGNGATTENVTIPTKVGGISDVASIAMNAGTACAIDGKADLYCWGYNNEGQVGDGTTVQRNSPVKIGGLNTVTSVALGMSRDSKDRSHVDTCAVDDSGVKCWGYGISRATSSQRSTPAPVAGLDGATAVATDVGTACAIVTDGKLKCWGNSASGQTGTGSTDYLDSPAEVPGIDGVLALAEGSSTTCAKTSDNLYCWGYNVGHKIIPGASEKATTPVKVTL